MSRKITKKNSSSKKPQMIDKKNTLKGIKLLYSLHSKKLETSNDLYTLSKNPFLYLNFVLNTLPDLNNQKVRHFKLAHSIYGKKFGSNLMFVLSNQVYKQNEELLENFADCWTFVCYDTLKKEYTEYKDKRGLLKDYTLFFCERKISPLMKKVLGKNFYERKKFPYPVLVDDCLEEDGSIKVQDFRNLLDSLLNNSTYIHLGHGAEFSLKVGRMKDMTHIENLKNVLISIKDMILLLHEFGLKKMHIRRIYVKLESSESLPIYSFLNKEEVELARQILEEETN